MHNKRGKFILMCPLRERKVHSKRKNYVNDYSDVFVTEEVPSFSNKPGI